jgi:hypothetical protein
MFELWAKMYDAMNQMVTDTLAGSFEAASSLMQRAAKQGFDFAGPGGAAVGGVWGWTYGSVLGLYQGAGRVGSIVMTSAGSTAGPRRTKPPLRASMPRARRVKPAKK